MDQILNRKRSREEDGDASMDFMPLSKRINNLHLTATSLPQIYDSSSSNSESMQQNYNQTPPAAGPVTTAMYNCPDHVPGSNGEYFHLPRLNGVQSQSQQQIHMTEYCPDLSILENPHYFLKNKLLFELHIQRLKRFQSFNL
ncbi:histone-lysine N-methyltransferase set1 [Sergentomyia squamirostris]